MAEAGRRLTAGVAIAAMLVWPAFRPAAADEPVRIASFNIQFLGNSKDRDNAGLAKLLAAFDLVFVQELVAPPYPGTFADGKPFKPDKEARAFFEAMKGQGFTFVLSEEDTGTGPTNHLNSSATEWFVAFYRPKRVQPGLGLAGGFLADDRSDHPDFERVPYAFPFRASGGDLVFVSVHLQPGAGGRGRRAHELNAIKAWIDKQPGPEADYVILGDMNIEDCAELASVLFQGWKSLNGDCRPTNTTPKTPKPYDHVLYNPTFSANELDEGAGLVVTNLIEAMRPSWPATAGPYPGDPYNHDQFRKRYSDHNPISFRLNQAIKDDD